VTCPACQAENDPAASACIACGETLDSQSPSMGAGTVFAGRYEILGALGRGGMGMVYRARDRDLREVIALKMIRPDLARQQHIERRFRSEIKLARRVRHPNVCSIYGDGEHNGVLYICMELIDGIELRDLVRGRRLSGIEAFDVAIQIAEGLAAIHGVGIIHRDLKTANIMRDRTGAVRLMDFGIAKKSQADGTTGATATGQVLGTPEYMSPEQIRGLQVDFRTDIYALGVVIYEIFTGTVPFRGETPVATIFKHLQEPPPLVTRGPRALPRSLVPVLRRALAKEPSARFSSAAEILAALRQAREEYRADPDPLRADDSGGTPAGAATLDGAATTFEAAATTQLAEASPSEAETRDSKPKTRARGRYVTVGAAVLAAAGVWTWSQYEAPPPVNAPATALTPPPIARPSPPVVQPSPPATTPSVHVASPPPARAHATPKPGTVRPGPGPQPTAAPATAAVVIPGVVPSPEPVTVYDEKDEALEVKPTKLSGRSAEYPREAPHLLRGERVSVTASFVVTESGDVTDLDVDIEGGSPGEVRLTVLAAYSRWKFSPGLIHGKPVRVRVIRRQTFVGG
jgi:serine/threonine protein kinase